MKKIAFLAVGLLATASALQAQTPIFTPGNIAVLRLSGNGSTASSGADIATGSAIYIDQYTTNGTLVSSYAVPSSGATSVVNVGLVYADLMTITPDGRRLVFTGYNVPEGLPASHPAVSYQTSSVYPREIATLDAFGDFNVAMQSSSMYSGYSIIGAASDGTNFWVSGNGPSAEFNTGIYPQVDYVGSGSASPVQVATNIGTSGMRGLNIYNVAGALQLVQCGYSTTTFGIPSTAYYGSGGFVLSNVSGALPTSGTGSSNYYADGTTSATAMDITINPQGTIAYVADDDYGIFKYTNGGSGWISNYSILPTNSSFAASGNKYAISITADWTQSPPVIYATTGETYTNRFVRIVDSNSLGQDFVQNLAIGVTNASATNTYRGVRFVPVPAPLITTQPVSYVGNPGQTATFSTYVLGPSTAYQWYSNSVANPTFVMVSGGTSSNLSLVNISTSQSGSQLYLFASNAYGTAQSSTVTLTVNNPAIVTEPVGVTNLVGSPGVTLSVSAVGTGTLTYQWLANGVPIANAHSSTYNVPGSTVSNSTTYTVIVTNTVAGPTVTSVTSTPAIVSYTTYLLYDTFSYPNGDLIGDPGSPWNDIVSTPVFLETNGRVQLSQTNGGDAQSLFIEPNVQNTVIWSSFIINLSTLPSNPGGTYFANLEDTNFGFYPALFAVTKNAYPGTYRLGISLTNVAYSTTTGLGGPDPTGVVPVDLAPGIDYQVVYAYDMANVTGYLSVNPSVTSDVDTSSFENDPNTAYTTIYALPTNGLSAAGLRQAGGEGVMQLDNLEVSLDTTVGSTTICGYCAVTAGITPQAPTIGLQPVGFTNYIGGSNNLEVAASAIGSGINSSYYWYKNTVGSPSTYTRVTDGGDVTGSSTSILTLSDMSGSDAGTYYVVVSNAVAGTQSASAIGNVISTPTPPFFVSPTNVTTNVVAVDGNLTLTALAEGSGPIQYDWFLDGTDLHISGGTLTINGITTNQAGTYTVVATGTASPPATSSNFIVAVTPPISTNIGYLISLMNSSTAPNPTLAASNTIAEYTVTGTVIVSTNLTAAADASYYIEDSTGGIDFYVSDPTFRPQMGDVVTVTGTLSLYYDTLELEAFTTNASETYSVVNTNGEVGTNATYPIAPLVLPLGYPQTEPVSTTVTYEGSFVILTNVYFETAGDFQNETSVTVTNSSGQNYGVTVYPGENAGTPFTSILEEPIPTFAYSVAGALNEYSATDWELDVTRYSDIVTAPPPPVNDLSAGLSGVNNANVVLQWTAIPYKYTYSILSSTNVAGPYTPLKSGLYFTSTNAAYTNVAPGSPAMFYQIISP